MKKIAFSIVIICHSFHCIAQKIALSDAVNISAPQKMEVLNKVQFTSSGNTKFNHSKVASDNIKNISENINNRHFYKIDDIFITLVHGNRSLKDKDNYLSATKKGYDAMNQKFKSFDDYSSVIKTINNNHVLIIYDETEKVGYYNFYCNDATNTLALNGILQFDVTDKDKATKILDDLIKSVEFKK